MKQFYIKGYNKRYSIREDGEVIQHYKYRLSKGSKIGVKEANAQSSVCGKILISINLQLKENVMLKAGKPIEFLKPKKK